ncbi:MAG: hypothetical protein NUV91_00190 [Candidatus Omnitrophica bacterium]|nr:hypothetical protein [Candidatus Omnitrophota bacterium]
MNYVTVPELGEGIKKVIVAHWHVKAGDCVQEEQDVVELVTDKATFNVPTPSSGVIQQILVDVGKEAKVGDPLAVIG